MPQSPWNSYSGYSNSGTLSQNRHHGEIECLARIPRLLFKKSHSKDGVVQSKSVRRRGAEQERGNDWQ
ncbi:hypothetical protein JHK82_055099 [Glycine max]|nr:hypothetical protein JHK86_054940 [Glycine max]KAG4917631.1 hypothetical protein JHK85_055912 [Glycine max]KAG5073731.1 hypothetical protein JHK84_054962 [Glycine max]KAG5076404.1 hypothetical protein JHK82_055099 [Glycine max]